MELNDHPFFKAFKKIDQKGSFKGDINIGEFRCSLAKAHPFVFDKKVIREKFDDFGYTDMKGAFMNPDKELIINVKDFSIPFKDSLYLFNDAPLGTSKDKSYLYKYRGILIHEISPEVFKVFVVSDIGKFNEKMFPVLVTMQIDLTELSCINTNLISMSEGDDFETHFHAFMIQEFTNTISVKRVGKQIGTRFITKGNKRSLGSVIVKCPNLYHIADKVEYEYIETYGCNENIKWQWGGWWRGHWRAFYKYDGGQKLKDSRGRNVVDYEKIGKSRTGERNQKGYTWVSEHIRGPRELAEVKTHFVVKGKS